MEQENLTKPIPLRFSPEDDIRLAVDKRKCVQRFAQHDIKGRSRGRQGIVMSLCSGRSNLRKRDGSLEVVACSDPDPQAVVLVECRGGEESSTASLKVILRGTRNGRRELIGTTGWFGRDGWGSVGVRYLLGRPWWLIVIAKRQVHHLRCTFCP
jgi:rhodanese-related sulfurtransferase